MRKENWPVRPKDVGPTGLDGTCLYCRSKLGEQHGAGCVVRERAVRVRMTFDYTVCVPEHWSGEDVEFHRNESSWCADNALDELCAIRDNQTGGTCSTCHRMSFEYLSEATEEESKQDGVEL